MTKVIDLHPDRNLINTNFEKYQFCSDSYLTKYEKQLQTDIFRLELNSSQESWLEARLFAFHNHLFKNPYDSSCWFIDKNGGIWRFKLDGILDLIYTSKVINAQSSKSVYNPSIAFASKNIFVVCNGGGSLEFLVENNECFKNILFNDIEPAVILDASFVKETSKIIVALYTINENEGKKFSRFIFLYYNYIQNTEDYSQSIKFTRKQTLKVKGTVEQAYIEKNGNFCHIISQEQVEFDYDSINLIKTKDDATIESEIKIPKYYWSQDEDSITVHIKIPDEYANFTAKVEALPTSLSIAVGDKILLKGKTLNKLEAELTTWKHKESNLEIELFKSENGLMWNKLIENDTEGEYLPNESLAAEIHSRLSHLCSNDQESNGNGQPVIGFNSEQLEECDLNGVENILQRVDLNNHSITHMAVLGNSNRILFTEKQCTGNIICLRYDHDGCVWILKESDDENWNLYHIHTFPGFGYIEASKANKKFCLSAPNGSFIAIVEHTKHIFLYEKSEKNTKVGKQRIINFGNEVSPILGAVATNKYLIILTKDILYQLQVYLN